MSKETLEFHHDKHHKAYLDAMTPMIEGTEYASMPIEEIVKKSYSDNPKLFNQAGQYYNHVHFWKWMKPNGGGKQAARQARGADQAATSARSTSSAQSSSMPARRSSARAGRGSR